MLHDFAKADQVWLDDLMRGISDGIAELAAGDAPRFLNAVALRMNPPREKPAKPAPIIAAAQPAPDTRSALERLKDRFRP